MLVAVDLQGAQVLAWRAAREEHFCPECRDPVFLKDGPIKVTHFSHYPSSSCSYGTGEGARHVALKAAVMRAFEDFDNVEFEKCVVPGHRADVVVPSARVVVECQASALKPEQWVARTYAYSRAGYSVLWVWDTQLLDAEYQRLEVLLCHRTCYGQVTACDPETEEWYSVHLDSMSESGFYLGKRRRRVMFKPLPDSVGLLKASNLDDVKIVNLHKPWWTKRSKAWAGACW